ncbi:nineteen complex-related protein 2-domain-containing protein [Penicillium digitatum]|nr:nineteen complex-related protein 2-domain-containing protein [Penicillium digitatum]
MSSKFVNRRKPRKIGVDDEQEDGGSASEPVVRRPAAFRPKQNSKLQLSFGPETSMNDGDQESEVVLPKRHGLGRKTMERSAGQLPLIYSEKLSARVGQDQDRPTYSHDYLKELRDSTPSTPKTTTDDETSKAVDVAAKFGEIMTVPKQEHIPSEAEIREKKARRARLAMEHGAADEFISLDVNNAANTDNWDAIVRGDKEVEEDTRLVRDDEDFAEGFEEFFTEDGKMALGRKAEREKKRKDRELMRDLIEDAEGISDEDDSDLEEKAAYEAAQVHAAMGHGKSAGIDRPKTPPKVTSLPRLASSFERLRTSLASMEVSKTLMISRMEELRQEKADIAIREVEIQAMIKEAGDNYERLKKEAADASNAKLDGSSGAIEMSRGLESIGAPVPVPIRDASMSDSSDSSFEDSS